MSEESFIWVRSAFRRLFPKWRFAREESWFLAVAWLKCDEETQLKIVCELIQDLEQADAAPTN